MPQCDYRTPCDMLSRENCNNAPVHVPDAAAYRFITNVQVIGASTRIVFKRFSKVGYKHVSAEPDEHRQLCINACTRQFPTLELLKHHTSDQAASNSHGFANRQVLCAYLEEARCPSVPAQTPCRSPDHPQEHLPLAVSVLFQAARVSMRCLPYTQNQALTVPSPLTVL